MKTRKRLRLILLIAVLVAVLIQFIPVDKSVPAVDPAQEFLAVTNPPQGLGPLLKDACYDCHSYETKYPWYGNVAPVSWWLSNHIHHARKHLNFSIWTTYTEEKQDHALKHMIKEVKEKSMPLPSFTWLGMHPEARLTDAQRLKLTTWFETLRGPATDTAPEGDEDHDD